uniref:Meiotic nuclear division protein 1 homolog n=1 Tax=Globisporangium ultimum (strain ATCC 200006 / CBS 805.95 / DAOM BR144) TaxID=431595 RepID=K3X901_GLOUD
MSKRKKGVSLEEKRERLLRIYHDAKDVFNLKEIEKLGAKAGVVLQTIKDVNQALVDDALVDSDKIGSGNYFWSFPSKVSQSRKRKLSELEQRKAATQEKLSKVQLAIETQKTMRTESDDRVQKLQRLAELQKKVKVLKTNIHHLAENDPEILREMERKVQIAKLGADRWTDNVFTMRSWVAQKRGCASSEVDKWLGIKDDFDYIE